MKKIILLICLLGVLVLSFGCNASVPQKANSNQTSTFSKKIESQKADEDELLYGKYPEPILKVIGENSDVNKDYKQLKRSDLDKVQEIILTDSDLAIKGYNKQDPCDISILGDMKNLKFLQLNIKNVKDFAAIKKLNSLGRLAISNIDDNIAHNISSITQLPSLCILDSSITNLDFLKDLPQLTYLSLYRIKNIESLNGIKYCTQLHDFTIDDSEVNNSQINTLPNMDNLTYIWVSNCKVTAITNFPYMPKLYLLGFRNCPVESINIPLEKVPALAVMVLNGSNISDIDNIKGMDNITDLELYDAPINYLYPVTKFKMLEQVVISTESAKKIKDLDKMKNSGINIEYNSDI